MAATTRTVLYTTPSAEARGGGQVSLLLLIERLDRARFRPVLLVPAEGAVADRARALGCAVRALELPPLRAFWRIPAGVLALRRLLREESVSIVHAEQPRSVVYAALARRGLGIPLIWHVRSMLRDRLDPLLERAADRLILVALSLEARFSAAGRAKSVVVRNGVDVDGPRPRVDAPAKPKLLIACVGRLEKDKGQRVLLDALELLRPRFPDAGLWLIGRDETGFGQELRPRAERLGGVDFLGHRDDARGLLARADVVAVPSFHEAFPRAVIEAMAEGKPVVASRVGGVPEAVEDGKTGFLVAPGDAEALAEALGRLLEDGALRERLGRAGRERAALFSTRAMVDAIQGVYDDALGLRLEIGA